jgi:hypothetical protein
VRWVLELLFLVFVVFMHSFSAGVNHTSNDEN